MRHKKIIGIITSAAAAICCVIPPFTPANAVSDTEIRAAAKTSIYDEYLDWSQMDERWGMTPMGGTTIRSSGCLITSLAIMLVHSGSIDSAAMANMGISDIEEFDPGVLADAYTSVGGFSYDGAISSWLTINSLCPQVQFGKDDYFPDTSREGVAEDIRGKLKDGWHVIARVNNGGFHWVYIQGVTEDGSIVMSDPAMETHDLYEAYPNGLQGEYWILKGANPPGELPVPPAPTGPVYDESTAGEYYVTSVEPIAATSEKGSGAALALRYGYVAEILGTADGCGYVGSEGFTAWIPMEFMAETDKNEHETGDINGDGVIDRYDLALISNYIQQSSQLPHGISTLSKVQRDAADINQDGEINSLDLQMYLDVIKEVQPDGMD